MVGDATKPEDVAKVVKGVDEVVSCLGNVKKDGEYILIMEKSHSNILDVAAEQVNIPRCVFISSVGCGGTSWLIKTMLTMIGGKPSFDDYEVADKRIREESKVPHLIVRPYALTDKSGTGKYKIIEKHNSLSSNKNGFVIIPYSVDIDNIEDFNYAEYLLKRIK